MRWPQLSLLPVSTPAQGQGQGLGAGLAAEPLQSSNLAREASASPGQEQLSSLHRQKLPSRVLLPHGLPRPQLRPF